MDHEKTAASLLTHIGGRENLISAAHCATRLRLVLQDETKVNKEALEGTEGVLGVFAASGQLQIIFGTGTVNKVYDAFLKVSGTEGTTKEELKRQAAGKGNIFQRVIKTLGDVFVPIIPAIVAGGLIMGLMEALNFMDANGILDINTEGYVFRIITLLSNAAFTFLPILIGFSAVKVFGGNPYLGAVIGMFLIHPDLQNAWTASEGIAESFSVFGLYDVQMLGYQGHVIPVVIASLILASVEKPLHRIVPEMLDLFVTPLVSLTFTAFVTYTFVGPVFIALENWIIEAVQYLITIPLGLGAFVAGGIYSTTVVAGIHHMYTIIDLGQISEYGFTYWLPIASAANIAQGAACLAVALRAKSGKLRSLALPSALSCMLGITEPAIFGVNLRYFRPFLCGAAGGAVGALIASLFGLGASGTGVTGIFGILLHLHAPVQYIIAMAAAAGTAFVLTWLFGNVPQGESPKEA